MSFVLDASIALAWCFDDEGGDYADAVLEALRDREALTASPWPLDVAGGLLRAERGGRIESQEATRAGRLLLALPITVDPVDRKRAFGETHRIARVRGLDMREAAYLELAARTGLPLATLDDRLRAAADEMGVQRFEPRSDG